MTKIKIIRSCLALGWHLSVVLIVVTFGLKVALLWIVSGVITIIWSVFDEEIKDHERHTRTR